MSTHAGKDKAIVLGLDVRSARCDWKMWIDLICGYPTVLYETIGNIGLLDSRLAGGSASAPDQ